MKKIKYYKLNKNIELKKSHEYDSGYDLQANIKGEKIIKPGEIKIIPVGIIVSLPKNTEGQIRPRSGLATKGITVINSPGTIDRGFLGEIKVILINHSKYPHTIKYLDRIAQIVFNTIINTNIIEVENEEFLNKKSERMNKGLGSTGT